MSDFPEALFHPLVEQWFRRRFRAPTSAQALAWPRIAAGEHVLLTAPTGSGKTLTAFLFALDRLIRGEWSPGAVKVLYISPLRALNNDIYRNLQRPLQEIGEAFAAAGRPFTAPRVAVRSGDTPEPDRRAMIRRPPEILITTPESLNILLTSKRADSLFKDVETLILDEVHAVAGGKRGTHLITAVERLAHRFGEFQRLALSATVTPLDGIARWIGGYRRDADGAYVPRPVAVIEADREKAYEISVRLAPPADATPEEASGEHPVWIGAARAVSARVRANRSTLVFANSRRAVERLARLLNTGGKRPVHAHHGSLSREIREVVEARLKRGELKGIVATNSLELGIDVGAIDEVVMLETPPSVAAMVQRIGRAGHAVGETSRGHLIALYPDDLINAAVAVEALFAGAVEALSPPVAPLDVLAQLILSMTAFEVWSADELFAAVRRSAPYNSLSRRRFDLVLEMLSGRYRGARVSALKPRIAHDRIDDTVQALPGAARVLYSSGGTIPDRGYFALRIRDTGAVIGELDEEFVWERKRGDVITLGVQAWRIDHIGTNDVQVVPCGARSANMPFWTCEERFAGAALAERRAAFLERADQEMADGTLQETLRAAHRFDGPAADALVRFLTSEKTHLAGALPHRRRLVIERVAPTQGTWVTILHNEWGGKVNRPLAIALSAALAAKGEAVRVARDNRSVALMSEHPLSADDLLGAVTPETAEPLVRGALSATGLFGAGFRENAARALLLLRRGFGRRTPLYLTRERAKALMAQVSSLADFPITLETFRACLQEEMELEVLRERLSEVADGRIRVTEVDTRTPSPFAAEVIWRLTGDLMYADDTPQVAAATPSVNLLDEVARSSDLRPAIPRDEVRLLEGKLRRTHPGYSPGSAVELVEWVKERLLIPLSEWDELLASMVRDHGLTGDDLATPLGSRIVSCWGGIAAVEMLPRLTAALGTSDDSPGPVIPGGTPPNPEAIKGMLSELSSPKAADLPAVLEEWLRFYGPVPVARITALLPADGAAVDAALHQLRREDLVVIGELTEGATGPEICHLDNLRRLLAMLRRQKRPTLTPLKLQRLPRFLAESGGLTDEAASLEAVLERLFGYAAPPALLEREVLPARLPAYRGDALDALLAASNLQWVGRGDRLVAFTLSDDRELFFDAPEEETPRPLAGLPDLPHRFSAEDLIPRADGAGVEEMKARLLSAAWDGHLSCNSFAPLREAGADPAGQGKRFSRSRRFRWRSTPADTSVWYRLPPLPKGDALDQEALKRDRVRMLLDRYGVLFRELLEREPPMLRWGALFRTLRLLELSGEVVGGVFFEGVRGIQFASQSALQRLRQKPAPPERVFWMNAADPAAATGLGLPGIDLPPRKPTSHLVFSGDRLVVVSKRTGKRLEIRADADHPRLPEYLGFLAVLLTRDIRPLPGITVETINGGPASRSPYRACLEAMFDTTADHRTVRLSRRY